MDYLCTLSMFINILRNCVLNIVFVYEKIELSEQLTPKYSRKRRIKKEKTVRMEKSGQKSLNKIIE